MKVIKRKVGESLSLEALGVRLVVTLLGHGSPPQLGVARAGAGAEEAAARIFPAHRPLQLCVGGLHCTVCVLPTRPGETRNALRIGVEAPAGVRIERVAGREEGDADGGAAGRQVRQGQGKGVSR